jgi:hypothetical protein
MHHTPTTTFTLVFAVNKIKHAFKQILLEKNIKKLKKLQKFCTAVQIFYRTPAGYTAERKTGSGARRKGEKEENGLLCAVVVHSPPPPPQPSLPHPARHFTCPRPGLSGLEEQGRAPPHTLTPFEQFEAAVADLKDGL